MSEKKYTAAVYARLSVDGGERKNESIEIQLELAKNFIREQKNMVLYDCYTDLGKTGTNFEREAFMHMMEEVEKGKINCIIVKDLSRFGRNHIETGNYIEKIFPALGVRLIAITDNFDSENLSEQSRRWEVHLKNLMNEMYAEDIAQRVRTGKKIRREQGSYTGGVPPYGFWSAWAGDRRSLLMEGGTAEIVKKIFELFSTGKNKQEILRFLYENKIMPPAEYHKTGRIYSKEGEALKQWSKGTVAAILKNPVYREIVGEDRFLAAAERAEFGRKNGGQKREPPEKDIFSGILYCGDCGGKMQKRAGRTHRYYCPAADRIDAFSCTKKSITRQALTELIKKAVGWELSNAAPQADKQGEKIGKAIEKRTGERKQLLERKIKNITRRESEQYEKYYFGEIEKEKWEQEKKACEKKKELLQKEAENLLEEQKAMEIAAELKQQLLDGQKEGKRQIELTEELVHSLIGRIELYSPKRVKVVFAFSHAYVPQGEGR